jgi:hypothetical protein
MKDIKHANAEVAIADVTTEFRLGLVGKMS